MSRRKKQEKDDQEEDDLKLLNELLERTTSSSDDKKKEKIKTPTNRKNKKTEEPSFDVDKKPPWEANLTETKYPSLLFNSPSNDSELLRVSRYVDQLSASTNAFLQFTSNKIIEDLQKSNNNISTSFVNLNNSCLAGIQNITLLMNSKMLELAFLKNVSTDDTSLSEEGCDFLGRFHHGEPQYRTFQFIRDTWIDVLKSVGQNKINILIDIKRCNETTCSLKKLIRDIFEKEECVDEKMCSFILVCCERHQFMLKNMPYISVHMTHTMPIFDNNTRYTVYINLVLNGQYYL